jgi:hypothetical protein
VGNVNNATDFLAPNSVVPEPGSLILLAAGISLTLLAKGRLRRKIRARLPASSR